MLFKNTFLRLVSLMSICSYGQDTSLVSSEEKESAYLLPVTDKGVLRSLFTEMEFSNPALNFARAILGSYTYQYGFAVGYAQRHKNSLRWSVGIGFYHNGYTYTSAYDSYNRSFSGNIPMTMSIGGRGKDEFHFRIGIKANPFVATKHTVYSDKYHTKDENGYTVSLDSSHTEKFDDPVLGISAMLVPQFVWYGKKKRHSVILTPLRPGILTYVDDRLTGGITITTSLSVEFFLEPREK